MDIKDYIYQFPYNDDNLKHNNPPKLLNLGNTCYINAIIQCILNINPLVKYLLSGKHINDIVKINTEQNLFSDNIIKKKFKKNIPEGNYYFLLSFLKILLIYSKNDDKFVKLSNFKHNFGLLTNVNFLGNDQQDSCEFLIQLLNLLEKILSYNINFKISDINNTEDTIKKLFLQSYDNIKEYTKVYGKSIISDIFNGQFLNIFTCLKCGNKTFKFEIFNMINLPVMIKGEKYDIYELLDRYISNEILDNDINCICCSKNTQHTKKMIFWKLPKVLIIHLKRFDNNLNKIISDFQAYPEISLKNYCTNEEEITDNTKDYSNFFKHLNNETSYKLSSICAHVGRYDSGHYYSYIIKDNITYKCSDTNIKEISNDTEIYKNSYIYFYEMM
jgi:ubiquitin carboxyl-terminal hydrolase 8